MGEQIDFLENRAVLAGAILALALGSAALVYAGGWSNVVIAGAVFVGGVACLLWLSDRSGGTSPGQQRENAERKEQLNEQEDRREQQPRDPGPF